MPELFPGFWNSLIGQRSSRLACASLLAALLAACGGSTADSAGPDGNPGGEVVVDALAAFKQQALNWQACDPMAVDEELRADLAQLGKRAQCALMRVPLDYADPSSAELQIEILKVAAQQPAQKLGAIVLNPGGPGEDGLSLAPLLSSRLAQSEDSEAHARLQEMSRRYDLVGFSPRGTGNHSPLGCALAETAPQGNSFHFDDSDENALKLQKAAQLFAQACAANPLSPHIHTEATARDMDLLRGLLGEEKLNYIGYSYGTWLGTWYAGLFPERTGRMLLDSNYDITSGDDETTLAPIAAEQRIIDEILLPHAASNPARFGLGNDPVALGQRLRALPGALKSALALIWHISERDDLERNIFAISAAFGLQDLLAKNPAASLSAMLAEIDAAPAFANSRVAADTRKLAMQLFFHEKPVKLSRDEFVHWSVQCNDGGTALTAAQWVETTRSLVKRYPLVEADLVHNPCLYWPASAKKRPDVAKIAEAAPLLMLQSEYDGLTPVEGARKTLAALPNAHLIVVDKEYRHGVFPYGTACVDNQVADYFLDGKLPTRLSSCARKEFVTDDEEDEDEDDDKDA